MPSSRWAAQDEGLRGTGSGRPAGDCPGCSGLRGRQRLSQWRPGPNGREAPMLRWLSGPRKVSSSLALLAGMTTGGGDPGPGPLDSRLQGQAPAPSQPPKVLGLPPGLGEKDQTCQPLWREGWKQPCLQSGYWGHRRWFLSRGPGSPHGVLPCAQPAELSLVSDNLKSTWDFPLSVPPPGSPGPDC